MCFSPCDRNIVFRHKINFYVDVERTMCFHVFGCALSVYHLRSHIYLLGSCVFTLSLCYYRAHGEQHAVPSVTTKLAIWWLSVWAGLFLANSKQFPIMVKAMHATATKFGLCNSQRIWWMRSQMTAPQGPNKWYWIYLSVWVPNGFAQKYTNTFKMFETGNIPLCLFCICFATVL